MPEPDISEHVLLVAPTDRDAEVTRRVLEQAGMRVLIEHEAGRIVECIERGIGALLLTDLALASADMPRLTGLLGSQPPWSSLPIVALCREAGQPDVVLRLLQTLPGVTTLDRPTTTRTLVSALRAALRSRRAQYMIRDQIQKLQRAEEALRQADRRKDEFLATLAHELRNPLAPMRTGIALLEQVGPGDARFGEVCAMMDRQLSHVVKLIDELLDVSRIATGKIVLHARPVDMREVVHTALESCEPALRAARHALDLKLTEEAATVVGDEARLAQVVANLVANAIKYTPPGGQIRISLLREGTDVLLRVADNGLGIPPAMLDRVFDLFAQVNQTLDRAQGGLGIGLSLVRKLAELHGGSVAASSAGAGQGSTFELRLPQAREAGLRAPVAAPAADPAEGRIRKVLVIDDNADAADSLGMLLGVLGHEVRVAYDGARGIETLAEFEADIVFCDIGMPGMDGYQVAAQVRGRIEREPPLLVALTGWGTESDRHRTQEAGFDHHLTKPASFDSVREILQGALTPG